MRAGQHVVSVLPWTWPVDGVLMRYVSDSFTFVCMYVCVYLCTSTLAFTYNWVYSRLDCFLLSSPGSSVGKAFCPESRVSWVRVHT